MDEEMRRAIVAEIAAATRVRTKQPWQFDVDDYWSLQPGISRQHAYMKLRKLVTAGELETELVTHHERNVRVFWRPGDKPATE